MANPQLKSIPLYLGIILALAMIPSYAQQAQAQRLGVDGDFLTYRDGSVVIEVKSVLRGGVAEQIGIQAGDRVLTINGIAPRSAGSVQPAIRPTG